MNLFIRIYSCSQDAESRSVHTAFGGHCRKHPGTGATGDVLIDSGVVLGGLDKNPESDLGEHDQRKVTDDLRPRHSDL